MSDLAYLRTVIRRMSALDWAHAILGGAILFAWALLLIGGPV
jgi:hypothetical protein